LGIPSGGKDISPIASLSQSQHLRTDGRSCRSYFGSAPEDDDQIGFIDDTN